MASKADTALVNKIIKLHGPVIDLRANPGAIIDILRRFNEPPDGGTPCGGVPSPPPPPSAVSASTVTNEDLMKAVLKLSREVSTIKSAIQKTAPKGR